MLFFYNLQTHVRINSIVSLGYSRFISIFRPSLEDFLFFKLIILSTFLLSCHYLVSIDRLLACSTSSGENNLSLSLGPSTFLFAGITVSTFLQSYPHLVFMSQTLGLFYFIRRIYLATFLKSAHISITRFSLVQYYSRKAYFVLV